VTVIFITHRLAEVRRLADRAIILRDGAVAADGPEDSFSDEDLIRIMVGRTLDRQFPERRRRPGEMVLQVENLTIPPRTTGVTFDIRAGEVVALTGLVGAGRTEVGRALFGAQRIVAGTVRLGGEPLPFADPNGAAAAGIGWVSEDRKGEGLILSMSVLANLTLPHLDRFARGGWIDRAAEQLAGAGQVERLSIRTTGLDQEVASLSGGNQQKVAIARWLLQRCRLLVIDEPTRGVDVGGRHDIYELLEELAGSGVAVLMISSDLPEVLGMADRIVVMHEGRMTGVLPGASATQEEILRLAMGRAA
jgi:ribose transport system ATP-binding protein